MKTVKMLRFPFFTYHFSVAGLNLERFLNLLFKEEIPLPEVRRTDCRTLQCRCHAADLSRIKAIADQKGWRIQNVRPCGLSAAAAFFKKRPGIPIGAVLALMLVFTLSGFIWRIDLHNAGPYEADLAAYLAQNGLRPGIRRSAIDVQALERDLLYRYPQLSWMHVYVSNVTLVVDVSQGVPLPEAEETQPSHLYAMRDGVVDSIRVFAGTAAVKPGDTVRMGQLLIRGEERGSDGETIPVSASGVVMARCWHSETVSVPLWEIHSTETGRETLQTRIYTPWFSIPPVPENAEYLASNLYVEEMPVAGCFFPVKYQRIIQRETALEYRLRDPETVRAEALLAAQERLKNALYGNEIIDKWTDYCMIEDESVSAKVTAEWLTDIGGIKPP